MGLKGYVPVLPFEPVVYKEEGMCMKQHKKVRYGKSYSKRLRKNVRLLISLGGVHIHTDIYVYIKTKLVSVYEESLEKGWEREKG